MYVRVRVRMRVRVHAYAFRAFRVVDRKPAACRRGGRKIYGRLHGVYRKLAIVINVLSNCITNVRFVKHGEQDGPRP